jgi:DHA3 family macrolide efflux protein-like MFS transporter
MQALFRNRNFVLVWTTSIFDNITLAIILLSQNWYVVDSLHAKSQLGLVAIATSVPRLGLMLFGGVIADRLPKVKVMTTTFVLRLFVMLGGAALFWSHTMSIWALVAVAASFGMLDAFFWPSRDALIPSIVGEAELTRANTVMQATNQIGLIIGPAIGGILLEAFPSFYVIYALTALMMAACALMIGSVRERAGQLTQHTLNRLAALQEGLRYVIASRVLRTQMSIYVIANLLFTGAVTVGIPIIASEHLTAGARGLSYLQSAYAFGMISGFITLMKFPPKKKRLALICVLIVIEGGLIALQGWSYSLPLSVALQWLLGFCVACNNVPMLSVLQQYTDRDKLGRVMSINSVSSMGLSPISYAIVSALLAGGASVGLIMPVFGLGMSIIIAVMAMASPTVRQVD